MYLKSIEMQGFKSFADKTKVVFDKGVTAVVGPNGSGKSNITESLRWALGESSAKSLRGGKMPDVIFAGTENRKPLNFATVTVTLDNSNGFIADKAKEIKVERQIYRSGDSEYLIDGKKVRLRDVHDLFMDTGLGRDSFSIISQGRVEAIFNSKPEERRAIFEEAAGVLKYKTRKKETESKLAQTQDNLDRLEDIIFELDKQVKPLEKQAQVAREFLDLDGKRSDLYLDVLVAQIQNGKKELSEKEKELGRVKADLSAYYQQRDKLELENQELKQERQKLNQLLEKEQALLLDVTRLISDIERKQAVHQLESSQNESSKQEAQNRLTAQEEKRQQTQVALEESQEKTGILTERLGAIQSQITALTDEIAHFSEDPDQVIEHLRETYVTLLQSEAEHSNQLAKLEQDLENHMETVASKAEQMQRLEADKTELEAEVSTSQQTFSEAEARLRSLLADYQTARQSASIANQTYQEEQEKLFSLLDQLKNKEARKNSLESILKNHSNFYAGVKAVLQQADQLGGIIGAVSEHVSFDARYQTAMEIALGAASQHIIVETEADAKSGISFLKKNRQGRATFLPLTTIKPRQISQANRSQLEKIAGFLGSADELVSYDRALSNIFQNLLGSIAIFETLEEANQAARATGYQIRIVTLDGSEIRPGGSFAGGANRNNNTLFIKPELEALQAEVTVLHQEITQQEKQVAKEKENLEALRQQLETIKEEGEQARLQEQKIRLQHEQLAERLADMKQLISMQTAQVSGDRKDQLETAIAQNKAALSTFEEKKQAITAQIEEVKTNRNAIQEQLQSLQHQQAELKLEERQMQSELGFEKETLKRLQDESEALEKEIILLQEIIQEKDLALDDTSLEVLSEQLQVATAKKTETEQGLIRLKFELEDIEGQFEDIEGRLEQARVKNDELIRNQAKLEAICEQIGQRLRTLALNLTEQFKMSFAEASKIANPLTELASAEQELKQLERSIRALGPVNLEAIEQFDQVSERLLFLNSQRDDVLSARDLLLGTIHEMDSEVKDRFKVTFEAIRESFQMTFKQMFGGGSADLVLTDSDLLTAGVEISVQPPGKKIQSLNLMSGGEKALSALALLFSIIRVKTIPFVILDEVEAALDEANVKRFGDYLNRFDKSSQFIVVTHRKGTMAAADAIYGVTMQESGVSKLVSVKLKDVESL
ncbi:chromosome segregation protein SMC [Streptococcus cameli]